ncbi:hypothetical protein CC85DRAFT_283276 [Cutaneotrichosporon oleaginosum]|uniref:Uncharacterized protein n=1 Tax=Cutaneotrichosporon oleaginosum TaxID=879819 RepID=A0A0J0XU92_9TREE|nr:uncharacterized protein CC85DRAFT_283276 [Cutaneotrichosporon oleaginosum]KLT44635.1 hypothetical protein CC85DRAFT_283276 [Cutaneotrichosporon oleaginosum]TXT07622.1 hypothetical protein COLE_04546 [Cutaneotrichosporon oleaginosum]
MPRKPPCLAAPWDSPALRFARLPLEERITIVKRIHNEMLAAQPQLPESPLRDEWTTADFDIPLCDTYTSLWMQCVWAPKKASIAIHGAFDTGNWNNVWSLTVTLAVADRVMQMSSYENDHILLRGSPLLPIDVWMAHREADIAVAYNALTEMLRPYVHGTSLPSLHEARRLALFCLRCTMTHFDAGVDMPDVPDLPELEFMNGLEFGPYAPVIEDLHTYGGNNARLVRGSVGTDASARTRVDEELDRWANENPDYPNKVRKYLDEYGGRAPLCHMPPRPLPVIPRPTV